MLSRNLTINRISNQNRSETAQNPARFFENSILAHSVKVVPVYMRKKVENFVYSPSPVTSKRVGKRVCNVLSFDYVRLGVTPINTKLGYITCVIEIVDIRRVMFLLINSNFFYSKCDIQ